MKVPRLVLPSSKYRESFLKTLSSLYLHPYKEIKMKNAEIRKDFGKFIELLNSQRLGKNLPKGWVPHTTYWLVQGNKYLGSLNIRHRLNANLKRIGGHIGYEITPKERGKAYGNLILKLGLKKAKAMGIRRVFVTCDATNLKSKKIIEINKGKFAGKVYQGTKLPYKLKYWIKNDRKN